MLNYAENTSSRPIVPVVPVSCRQSQEPTTRPLSEGNQPHDHPEWTLGEDFGEWLYQGKRGEIRLPRDRRQRNG